MNYSKTSPTSPPLSTLRPRPRIAEETPIATTSSNMHPNHATINKSISVVQTTNNGSPHPLTNPSRAQTASLPLVYNYNTPRVALPPTTDEERKEPGAPTPTHVYIHGTTESVFQSTTRSLETIGGSRTIRAPSLPPRPSYGTLTPPEQGARQKTIAISSTPPPLPCKSSKDKGIIFEFHDVCISTRATNQSSLSTSLQTIVAYVRAWTGMDAHTIAQASPSPSSFHSPSSLHRPQRNAQEQLPNAINSPLDDLREENNYEAKPYVNAWQNAASPSVAEKAVPSPRSQMERNVVQTADTSQRDNQVLKEISGYALPGELIAIIGASGSGKTTLLNALSGRLRKDQHEMSGAIHVNGSPVHASQLSALSAYVMQDDALCPVLSAYEHVLFSARLRTKIKYHDAQEEAKLQETVQSIIDELGLTEHAHQPVGSKAAGDGEQDNDGESSWLQKFGEYNSWFGKLCHWLSGGIGRGLSGGQQKRVSLGIELISNPRLIFCDEVLSGLDSASSLSVVRLLKTLAVSKQRTVIMTVHTPSQRVFELFDKLLLLTPCGTCAYFGPAAAAIGHFSALGYPPAAHINHACHLLASVHQAHAEGPTSLDRMVKAGKAKQVSCSSDMDAATLAKTLSRSSTLRHTRPSIEQPFIMQFALLLRREILQQVRRPINYVARILQNLFLTFFIGLLFLDSDNDQRSIYARVAFIFFIIANDSLLVLVSSVLVFAENRAMYRRERSSHLYRVSAYFHAKSCVELVMQVTLSFSLSVIAYFMVGMKTDAPSAVSFFFGIALLSLAINSIGLFLGAMAPSATIAVLLSPMCLVPSMLTSSFFLDIDSIPEYFWPIRALSAHYYAFTSLFVNEFKGLTFMCSPSEAQVIYVQSTEFFYCFLTTGERVMDMFHLSTSVNYGLSMLYLILLCMGFRALTFLVLFLKR